MTRHDRDLTLAIDIGGTQFRVALFDGHRLVKRVRRNTQREKGASWIIDQIVDIGRQMQRQAPEKITACGIGFGGPVDFRRQRVLRSLHVTGWTDVNLPEVIEEALGIPCVIDNDANVGAMGEFHFGAGKTSEGRQQWTNMVYYTVSTGVGGGIIINGQPYRGSRGFAGELGHAVLLADSNVPCVCGTTGCLEAYCSGPSIANRARLALEKTSANETSSSETGTAPLTAKDVFQSGERNPIMRQVIDETIHYLGAAIASVCNVLDPDGVVIGGGVSQAGDPFIQAVETIAHHRMLHGGPGAPPIVASGLGDDSVLWGALALAHTIKRV